MTERGEPIAVIKPLKDERDSGAALKRMADEGLVRLPTRDARRAARAVATSVLPVPAEPRTTRPSA